MNSDRFSNSMGNSLCTTSNTHSQLIWGEQSGSFLSQGRTEKLGDHSSEKISDGDGTKAVVFLLPCYQPCTT